MPNDMILSQQPSKIIRKYLMDMAVISGAPGNKLLSDVWYSTYDFMPDMPARIVTVFHSSGFHEGSLITGERTIHPAIQILVRDGTIDGAYSKAAAIAQIMEPANEQPIEVDLDGDTLFKIHSIRSMGGIVPLGADRRENTSAGNTRIPKEVNKSDNFLVSQNFLVTVLEEDR